MISILPIPLPRNPNGPARSLIRLGQHLPFFPLDHMRMQETVLVKLATIFNCLFQRCGPPRQFLSGGLLVQ